MQDWVWKTENKRILRQKFRQPVDGRKIKIYLKISMA